MDRSIADQELFLPEDNQNRQQHQQTMPPPQTRYYANPQDEPPHSKAQHTPLEQIEHPHSQAQYTPREQSVPAVNVIPATPSTLRSLSVRSDGTQGIHNQAMSGALANVVEEDDMYGSADHSYSSTAIPPIPAKSPARSSPAMQPAHPDSTAPYVPPQPLGDVPSEPPTYDEYRQSRTDEAPPLPGPWPTAAATAVTSSSHEDYHPSVHLDADQDYAYALQLQEEEENRAPPLPQRPRPAPPVVERSVGSSSVALSAEEQDRELARRLQDEEDNAAPGLPTRSGQHSTLGPMEPPPFTRTPSTDQFLPPPQRKTGFGTDNPSDPIHYSRDPHKLIAYLVPFPIPQLKNAPAEAIPKRFLIYTPPPPPLKAPLEGVKEDRTHKVQRKWQDEVRKAKLSEAKTTSWPGFKAKMTRGVSKAMTYTTTSNLDFLSRVKPPTSGQTSVSRSPSPPTDRKDPSGMAHEPVEDPTQQAHDTKKTVPLEELIFIYSPSTNQTPAQMRTEFINTVMRTKSKAMRDSVIATGLLPISLAVDIVLIAVSGIFEVNAAWAYFNIKGAKTARSMAKRLSSSTKTAEAAQNVNPEKTEAEIMQEEDKLRLTFKPAERIDVLARYLAAECHKVESKLFPEYKQPPSKSDCLEAIGWAPHETGGQKNWEDEAWELNEVKDDLRLVMHKAAKEWRGYVKDFEKNPEKNLNK